MKQKKSMTAYWKETLLGVFAVAVFCFWQFFYPFIPLMRETAQLFLLTYEYFLERIVLPGGLAQYVSEFIVQFFFYPTFAALFYALLFVLLHWLTSKLLKKYLPVLKEIIRYALSYIPSFLMIWVAMIPYIPLTPTIAVLMVMTVMLLIPESGKPRLVSTCLSIIVLYWLAGPVAVLLLFCYLRWIPLTATLFACCVVVSSLFVPYPLRKIACGIDYNWRAPDKELGTFEEMECDMLMRSQQWQDIIDKYTNPKSPAVRSAVLLAYYQSKQIGQKEFYSRMIIPIEMMQYEPSVFNISGNFLKTRFGTLTSANMLSDMAFVMNLPMVTMRTSFETMEFIPNYNKSSRSIRRLIQTNMITGNYDVALKYIRILENTICYRKWARNIRALVEHPEHISNDYFYNNSQKSYANTEDMFFI